MKPWRFKVLQRLFFKNADRIIAVSEIIKIEYEKRTGNKIKVILPLIPFTRSASSEIDLKRSFGLDEDDKIILVVGSLKPIKGSEIILKSFLNLDMALVKKEILKLIFVGDGPQRKALESRVLEYQEFAGHVHFWGNITHDKLPDVYAIANIYVIASWFEGTPKTLLEAMYNGLPIIGSNVNGINNIISDRKNGLLFEKNNDLQLSEHIKFLIQNKKTAAQFGVNARTDYNEKNDLSKTIRAFEDLYNCYLSL
jgi:glycosyltransferase involved in cell wall biosynthesis